jgi:membrane protein CcdC involved in cytochrome C biogenesis
MRIVVVTASRQGDTAMEQVAGAVPQSSVELRPEVGSCYGNAWRRIKPYFVEVLLVTITYVAILAPAGVLTDAADEIGRNGAGWEALALIYLALVVAPVRYGAAYAYMKAARGDRLQVSDMFDVFNNYLNSVLANLFVFTVVGIGVVLFIVPGIVFACRLAFVPYLIVDRKMEVVEAVKLSWHMTRGHAWTVFLMALLAIPIVMVGFACLGVGILGAMIWIGLAFGSLYHAVSSQEETSQQTGALSA